MAVRAGVEGRLRRQEIHTMEPLAIGTKQFSARQSPMRHAQQLCSGDGVVTVLAPLVPRPIFKRIVFGRGAA